MSQKISIIDLIRELPLDEMREDAKKLGVDYKSKKLDCISLLAYILQSFLLTTRLSQRKIGNSAGLMSLHELFGINIHEGKVSHSSISERLSTINPKFFEDSYGMLHKRCQLELGSDELYESRLVRIDTTLVAETSNKLLEGIVTGVNERFGGERRQIKYGMAFDGFGAILSKIFKEQIFSGDEVALSQTVIDAISSVDGKHNVFLFDRGVSSVESLKDISRLAQEKSDTFVARVKISRKINVLRSKHIDPSCSQDGNIRVTDDYIGNLRKYHSPKWDDTEFRFLKVEFCHPRPKSASHASHRRKYQDYMILITNDFTTSALTIAQYYLKRWDIEVFFKFLKQNLSFAHLISVNPNGIQVVLYITLIMALLIKLYQHYHNVGPTMAIDLIQVELANWLYMHPVALTGDNNSQCKDISRQKVFRPL